MEHILDPRCKRKESAASARFLVTQLYEFACWPAAIRRDPLRAQSRHSLESFKPAQHGLSEHRKLIFAKFAERPVRSLISRRLRQGQEYLDHVLPNAMSNCALRTPDEVR